MLAGVLGGLDRALQVAEVVGAEALLAVPAVDERVGEAGEVAAGLPHARVLEDRRVQGDDVVALLEHRAPPLVLDVGLEQDAVVAVVVRRPDAAVDLAGGEDEAAALAQRHDLVHRHEVVRGHRPRHAIRGCPTRPWHSYTQSAMPIYEYKCDKGHVFEVMQRMTDDPVAQLPDVRRARPAGLPPGGRALQGQGLLQHRLRHQEARAGDQGVRRRLGRRVEQRVASRRRRRSPRASRRTPPPRRRSRTEPLPHPHLPDHPELVVLEDEADEGV